MNALDGGLMLRRMPDSYGISVEYCPTSPFGLGQSLTSLLTSPPPAVANPAAWSVAMTRALAHGTSIRVTPSRETVWRLLVLAEHAEAMVRRLTRLMPAAVGLPPAPAAALEVRKTVQGMRQALPLRSTTGAISLCQGRLTASLAELSAAFDRLIEWHERRPIPEIDTSGGGVQTLIDEAWREAPRATADQLAAAITDAASIEAEAAWPAIADAAGTGAVETAHGRLTLEVQVRDGIVRHLTICTATDRLFGPQGPARLLLECWQDGPANLRVLMAALDPEVPWRNLPAHQRA